MRVPPSENLLPEKPEKVRRQQRKQKPRITDRLIAEALKVSDGYISFAARDLGCSQSFIRKRMMAHPSLREIRDDAREEVLDIAEFGLKICISNREPWAIQFALRTIGRARGYVEPSKVSVELSGAGGGPIKHEHTMQHLLQELENDPVYAEAARQHAVNSSRTIDAPFARPVGLPAPGDPGNNPAVPSVPAEEIQEAVPSLIQAAIDTNRGSGIFG
jgi:hypothetical protein